MQLRELLSRELVKLHSGEAVVVERYNTPIAALISIEDYWKLRTLGPTRPSKEEVMPTQRLVVANASGGEGKSTIARELAYSCAGLGLRVALFDLDPQASLTKSLGLHDDPESVAWHKDRTVLGVFASDEPAPLPDPIHVHGVDVWPANDHLTQADTEMAGDMMRIGHLRSALNDYLAEHRYDVVILDTKPGRSNFLVASLAAADHLLVPVSGLKGLENLKVLLKVVENARLFAPHLQLRAFVPNRIRENVGHHRELLAVLHEDMADLAPILPQVRDSLATVGGALEHRLPVVRYKPSAPISEDFAATTRGLLAVLGLPVPA
ncbi:hypothetical protein Dxin01_00831 [Deinococcus xinjiangensis]|uniref:AAA domain-containing protein n=2 Tax=Deinococcus xinjiangensis TaxID=457454 RepID=A0ABP9V9A0_9DEIO